MPDTPTSSAAENVTVADRPPGRSETPAVDVGAVPSVKSKPAAHVIAESLACPDSDGWKWSSADTSEATKAVPKTALPSKRQWTYCAQTSASCALYATTRSRTR